MFGYITVNKKQLSDEQIKTYQEYYCGLCRKLKTGLWQKRTVGIKL